MRQHFQYLIILMAFILTGQTAVSQIGIRAKYLNNGLDDTQVSNIEQFGGIENALSTGFGLGVDYWIRLKTKRIEFLPELGVNYSQNTLDFPSGSLNIDYNYIYFNLNTRIYPMDFEGDCDCPTFSNQSTLIKKGFYFELSPGLGYYTSHYDTSVPTVENPEGDLLTGTQDGLSYKLGLAVGLDIGLSNLITINPYAMYNYHFGRDHETSVLKLFPFDIETGGTSMSQIELGLRFAIRFDAKNY